MLDGSRLPAHAQEGDAGGLGHGLGLRPFFGHELEALSHEPSSMHQTARYPGIIKVGIFLVFAGVVCHVRSPSPPSTRTFDALLHKIMVQLYVMRVLINMLAFQRSILLREQSVNWKSECAH